MKSVICFKITNDGILLVDINSFHIRKRKTKVIVPEKRP